MQKLIVIAIIVGLAFAVGGCASKQQAQPTAIAKVQSPKVGLTTPENQKVMIAGNKSKFSVKLDPEGSRASVSSVTVWGDNGIICEKSSESEYTWYCTGSKPVEVATVFVKVSGDFPDSEADYTVQVVAPTPTAAPPTPTAAPANSPSPAQTVAPTSIDTPKPTQPIASTPACVSYRVPFTDTGNFGGTAKIQTPQDGATGLPAAASVVVAGTFAGKPQDATLWLLVYPPNDRYYPQSSSPETGDPMTQTVERWRVNAWLGDKGGPPECFDLVLVYGDARLNAFFGDWLRNGFATGSYPGIPQAALQGYKITEKAYITVQTVE